MLGTFKAEFRKLLTVRSTYILTIVALLLAAFFATFVFGYKQSIQQATSPVFLNDIFQVTLGIFTTFGAIIAILLMAHEYRYNTILYTLAWSRSRLKVLLAKVLAVLSFMTVGGVLTLVVTYIGVQVGLALKGNAMGPQDFDILETGWRYLMYLWGYGLVGLVMAALLRNLVASIVAFFIIPTLEGTLGSLLLKEDAKYLPFRSLDTIPSSGQQGSINAQAGFDMLSSTAAAGVVVLYLLAFGAVALILFIKRDAND